MSAGKFENILDGVSVKKPTNWNKNIFIKVNLLPYYYQ